MTDTYKFPGGNDVKVVRKEDIINTINCNIVDKEVALAIVKQCEVDAANFLRKGRWTGIPFIGSIRVPKRVQRMRTKEVQDLLEEAKNVLADLKKASYVVENVKNNLNQTIYKTIIPRNIRLAEAPSHGLPINVYDSKSTGAESYRMLAEEVIHRGEEEWQ